MHRLSFFALLSITTICISGETKSPPTVWNNTTCTMNIPDINGKDDWVIVIDNYVGFSSPPMRNQVSIPVIINKAVDQTRTGSFYQCTQLVAEYLHAAFNADHYNKDEKDLSKSCQGFDGWIFHPEYNGGHPPYVNFHNGGKKLTYDTMITIEAKDAEPGDVLRSSGHVAIIKRVDKTDLNNIKYIIYEQNKWNIKIGNQYEIERSVDSKTYSAFRMNVTGCYENGWKGNDTSKAFFDVFNKYKNKIGFPFNNGGGYYVHQWKGVWIQDFKKEKLIDPYFGDDGESAIIYNTDENKAYLIHDGFWGYYKYQNAFQNLGEPLGEEVSNPDVSSTQHVSSSQLFKHGKLMWHDLKSDDWMDDISAYNNDGTLIPKYNVNFRKLTQGLQKRSSESFSDSIFSNGVFMCITPATVNLHENFQYSLVAKRGAIQKTIDFKVGSKDTTIGIDNIFNPPTPFQLTKAVTCSDTTKGDIEWSKITIGEKDTFQQGQDIIGFFELRSVTASNISKVVIYRNGDSLWTYGGENWYPITDAWSYMYLLPKQTKALPGTYTFKLFISLSQSPLQYNIVDSVTCTVLPDASIPNYILTQKVTCDSSKKGEIEWSKEPMGVRDTFMEGEDITAFFEFKNVIKSNISRVVIYYNGDSSWTYGDRDWYDITGEWSYMYLLPLQQNAQIGEYKFVASISYSKSPKIYQKIDSLVCYVIDGRTNTLNKDASLFSIYSILNNNFIFNIDNSTQLNIKIFNLNGKLVLSKDRFTDNNFSINVDILPKGVYIMNIYKNRIKKSYRFSKIN